MNGEIFTNPEVILSWKFLKSNADNLSQTQIIPHLGIGINGRARGSELGNQMDGQYILEEIRNLKFNRRR